MASTQPAPLIPSLPCRPSRVVPGPTGSPPQRVVARAVRVDERARVIDALEHAGWVQARAARLLGMTPRQIAYRILTLNIEVKKI